MDQSKAPAPTNNRAEGSAAEGSASRGRSRVAGSGQLAQLQALADQSPDAKRLAALTRQEKKATAANPLQPLIQRRPVKQFYRDLAKIYANPKYDINPETEENDKAFWLSWFHKVQVILSDGAKVRESLRQLSSEMVQMDRTLAEALATHLNPSDQRRVILTGFVPPDSFRKLVMDGHLFEDYVRREHGVYSHQLQWYTIQQQLGETAAQILRRETLKKRWNAVVVGSTQSMWDNIVDGLPSERNALADLTIPNIVTDYVLKVLVQDPQFKEIKPALGEIARTDKNHAAIRGSLRLRYPRKKDLKGGISVARKKINAINKALKIKSNQANGKQRTLHLERAALFKEAANLELRTTTKIHGERMTIDWTGWVGTKNGVEPILEPTIAKVV